jgi:chemotaxis family two-component system response regulator Rcp1
MITPTNISPLYVGGIRSMPAPGATPPVQILLVEDNPDHAALMLYAFAEGSFDVAVHVVEDGEEALCFLRRLGAHANAPAVELILLDLQLPRVSGQEVLAEIKQDPHLRRIPVMVLTSSDDEEVVMAVHDLHANCFVPKPGNQEEFAQIIQRIETFWCGSARRPRVI